MYAQGPSDTKSASGCVHSYKLWFNGLRMPICRLIGEEDNGFHQVLDGLNEERLAIAAECVGLGEIALAAGIGYGNEHKIFYRKIGANQARQHPIAKPYTEVQAANQVTYNAAGAVDSWSKVEVS